jgi:hypothetical protein
LSLPMPRRARKPPPSPVIGRDCHDFSKCCHVIEHTLIPLKDGTTLAARI